MDTLIALLKRGTVPPFFSDCQNTKTYTKNRDVRLLSVFPGCQTMTAGQSNITLVIGLH